MMNLRPALRPGCSNSHRKKPVWTCVRGVTIFPMEVDPDAAWQIPRWTARRDLLSHLCRDVCTLWPRNPWPVHPFCSIRRFHRCGVSRPIALHTCQMLKPTIPYPCMSAVRSRRPAVSGFASESHLRAPQAGGISGPAGQPARPTLASSRGSRVSMHMLARDQPSPSICSRNPELPVAARRESPF